MHMNLWFLAPEILSEVKIATDANGVYRVSCHPSDKPKRAKPEEIIRQLVMIQLRNHYHYPHDRLIQEYMVRMGIAKKRADIAIVDSQQNLEALIEIKQVIDEDSISQLHSYMFATGAGFGAVISLSDRKVFMRDKKGLIQQIADLPIYEKTTNFDSLPIVNQDAIPTIADGKTVMATLGITGLARINSKSSELQIKGAKLLLSNVDLLNYTKVRKSAIGIGIVLPGTVEKTQWDEMLISLFDNATEIQQNTAADGLNESEKSFNLFLDSACENCDPSLKILFKDIYSPFVKWYKVNVDKSCKHLPSKKNISSILRKNGFERLQSGGQSYYYGLRILDQMYNQVQQREPAVLSAVSNETP